jgi:hypothetical protein
MVISIFEKSLTFLFARIAGLVPAQHHNYRQLAPRKLATVLEDRVFRNHQL